MTPAAIRLPADGGWPASMPMRIAAYSRTKNPHETVPTVPALMPTGAGGWPGPWGYTRSA